MRYNCQCWTCGRIILLTGRIIHAGNYPCPSCEEGMVRVPETPEHPTCQPLEAPDQVRLYAVKEWDAEFWPSQGKLVGV